MTAVSAELGLRPDADVLRPRVWIGGTVQARVQFRDDARRPVESPGPVTFLWKSPGNVVVETAGIPATDRAGAVDGSYQPPMLGRWAYRAETQGGVVLLDWAYFDVLPEPVGGPVPQVAAWLRDPESAVVTLQGTHLAGATIPQFPEKATFEGTDSIPAVDAEGASVRLPGQAVLDAAVGAVAPIAEEAAWDAQAAEAARGQVEGIRDALPGDVAAELVVQVPPVVDQQVAAKVDPKVAETLGYRNQAAELTGVASDLARVAKLALDNAPNSPQPASRPAIGWRRTIDWANRGDLQIAMTAAGLFAALIDATNVPREWSPSAADYVAIATVDQLGVAKVGRRTIDWANVGAVEYRMAKGGHFAAIETVAGRTQAWNIAAGAYVSPLYDLPVITPGPDKPAVAAGLVTVRTIDWPNIGASALTMTAAGQFSAFTDQGNTRQTWRTTTSLYMPPDQVRPAIFAPASYPTAEAHARQIGATLREMGVRSPNGTPAPPTGNNTKAPVVSNDQSRWPYHAWQIPGGCQVIQGRRQREFRVTYGRNDLPPGAAYPNGDLIGGEGAPCYVTLEYSDDGWQTVGSYRWFFLPNTNTDGTITQGVLDPHIFAMPEGPVALLLPITGPASGSLGNGRTVYGFALMNPMDPPEEWVFGPASVLGRGFVGKPNYHGGEVRFTCADTAAAYLVTYCRLRLEGNVLKSDLISTIPNPELSGFGKSFAEAWHMPVAPGVILVEIRVGPFTDENGVTRPTGRNWYINRRDGEEGFWEALGPNPLVATNPTRLTALLLPNGMHAYIHHPVIPSNGLNRAYGSISISDDGMKSFRWTFRFETRNIASYFDAYAIFNLDGSWGGKLRVTYDRGRNRVALPGGPAGGTLGEICAAEVDVFSIIQGNPAPAIIRDFALPI